MDKKRFEAGLKVRRSALGEEIDNETRRNTTEFSKPLQDLNAEYLWGSIWTRPGLPKKTRSLITLGILTALNKPVEIKLHAKGAIRNGCTKEEVMEALLQATVYCGVPAGVEAFRAAQEALSEGAKR